MSSDHPDVPADPPQNDVASADSQATLPPAISPLDSSPLGAEPEPAAQVSVATSSELSSGVAVHLVGVTDVGLIREHNEDNFTLVRMSDDERNPKALLRHAITGPGTLLVVCDGMGGAAAGEVASSMAVETLPEVMRGDLTTAPPPGVVDDEWMTLARKLRYAAEEANRRIFVEQQHNVARAGMGTTMTAAILRGNKAIIAQVGDSRAYVQRKDTLTQVTRDQSLVNQLLETGQITAEQAKYFEHSNVILQALGVQEDVDVQLSRVDLRRGDRLLLCSDGLVGVVSDEEIAEVMCSGDDPAESARVLIELANAGGGPDNITVVIAHLDGADLPEPTVDDVIEYETWHIDPPAPQPAPQSVTMEADEPPLPAVIPVASPVLRAVEVLSMAVIVGLVAGSIAVGSSMYDRAEACQVHAGRAGMVVMVDGHDSGVRSLEGTVPLRLRAGHHRVWLANERAAASGVDPEGAAPMSIDVVVGQACVVTFDDPAPVEGAAETPR